MYSYRLVSTTRGAYRLRVGAYQSRRDIVEIDLLQRAADARV